MSEFRLFQNVDGLQIVSPDHTIIAQVDHLGVAPATSKKWAEQLVYNANALKHAQAEIERLKATIRHYDSAEPDIEKLIARDGGPGCGKYDC